MAREPDKKPATDKPVIVEATGAASAKNPLGRKIEDDMRQAIIDANNEGITDAETIKKRIAAAVEKAKNPRP